MRGILFDLIFVERSGSDASLALAGNNGRLQLGFQIRENGLRKRNQGNGIGY